MFVVDPFNSKGHLLKVLIHYYDYEAIDVQEIISSNHNIMVSRHTIVCRAAQEAGAPHREYIDRKNENVIFTPLYLGDHLSDWNQICYTVARQPRESTFQI